jgi:hypothetical protein
MIDDEYWHSTGPRKGSQRTDQYPSNSSPLRNAVKWSNKVVLYLINCVLLTCYVLCAQGLQHTHTHTQKESIL